MKKRISHVIGRVSVILGICLLLTAIALLVFWNLNIETSVKRAESIVSIVRASTPSPQSSLLETRRDNSMSALSVDGTDFVGIIEMPRYGSVLPICADWGNTSKYPCRFSGSIYDSTMQIGATTQKGQYDFYRELSVGDEVFYTDMEGNRYSYEVKGLRYEKHADQSALHREESSLVLFIKNVYSFEYLIVFCDAR